MLFIISINVIHFYIFYIVSKKWSIHLNLLDARGKRFFFRDSEI